VTEPGKFLVLRLINRSDLLEAALAVKLRQSVRPQGQTWCFTIIVFVVIITS
jgi:hypothetical protein